MNYNVSKGLLLNLLNRKAIPTESDLNVISSFINKEIMIGRENVNRYYGILGMLLNPDYRTDIEPASIEYYSDFITAACDAFNIPVSKEEKAITAKIIYIINYGNHYLQFNNSEELNEIILNLNSAESMTVKIAYVKFCEFILNASLLIVPVRDELVSICADYYLKVYTEMLESVKGVNIW